VSVEVAATLALTVDQQIVAVEHRVIAGAHHLPRGGDHQGRAAASDDVEAFVRPATIARGAELADRATRPVWALNGKKVVVVGDTAVAAGDPSRRRRNENGKEDEDEKGEALQWCSMTRSTMLYSFASSALMK
jgi:hypothetical protein